MNEANVKKVIKELKEKIETLEEELGIQEEVVEIEGDAEQLLFDISCLDDTLKKEYGDWIYYINQIDDVNCGEIWKVRTNGEDNQLLLQDSGCYQNDSRFPYIAKQITEVDGKWIEYCATESTTNYDVHSCIRKVTIYGKMDQQISDTKDVAAKVFMSNYYSDWKENLE